MYIKELREATKNDPIKWERLLNEENYWQILKQWHKNKIDAEIKISFERYTQKLFSKINNELLKCKADNILIITHDHVLRTIYYYFFNEFEKRISYLHGFVISKSDFNNGIEKVVCYEE